MTRRDVHEKLIALVPSLWTPKQLPGLVAWYKADAEVYSDAGTTLATNGQTAQQWNDQSGNGYHMKQGTSGARPTYNTTGFNSSYPCLNGDGARWMLTDFGTVAMGSNPQLSFFFVGDVSSGSPPAAGRRIIAYFGNGQGADWISNSGGAGLLWWITNDMQLVRNGANLGKTTVTYDTRKWYLGIFDGTNSTVYDEGANVGTPSANSVNNGGTGTLALFTESIGGDLPWKGNCAEIVVTNTDVSTYIPALDRYVSRRYGF